MTTVADIRARIEAILADIPGVNLVITDDGCAIADDSLMAVIVMSRGATRSRANTDKRIARRNFELGAFLVRLCEGTPEEQRAALVQAEAMMDVIPDWFAVNAPRLRRLDAGIVWQVDEMSDSGLETRAWGDELYYAVTYTLPVETKR